MYFHTRYVKTQLCNFGSQFDYVKLRSSPTGNLIFSADEEVNYADVISKKNKK